MADRPPSARALRWRLALARIEAALTSPANAVLLGGTGVATVTCLVLESRGLLNLVTWAWVLAAGGAVLACKIVLDLRDRAEDDRAWRASLGQAFGTTMRDDPEVARLARLAIEYRVRLAMAEARASRTSRKRLSPLLPQVDDWLNGIVKLARQVAALRNDARFHVAMAGQGRQRQARIGDGPPSAGLDAQVRAGEGFGRVADGALLRLENAVGAFGAGSSQMILALAHSDAEPAGLGGEGISAEIAAIDRQLRPEKPDPQATGQN